MRLCEDDCFFPPADKKMDIKNIVVHVEYQLLTLQQFIGKNLRLLDDGNLNVSQHCNHYSVSAVTIDNNYTSSNQGSIIRLPIK